MQPRMPLQGGMGPRMMGQGFGGRGPFMGMNQMQQNPRMNSRMMGRGPQMGQKGGLLSKLFSRGNQTGGMNRLAGMSQSTRAAGGGGSSILQSLSSPGGLTGILNNTQQVLRSAQTLGPMIQQYGPIVKNLPAMWKLYRGFKNATADSDKEKDSSSKESVSEKASESSEESSSSSITEELAQIKPQQKKSQKEKGASIPKLYI